MKVYDKQKKSYWAYGKDHCYVIDPTRVKNVWLKYLQAGGPRQKLILAKMVKRLTDLRDIFQTSTPWTFISSSLLFIYEGGSANDSLIGDFDPHRCGVYMIDFGNVYSGDLSVDNNYLYGIEKLLECLSSLQL